MARSVGGKWMGRRGSGCGRGSWHFWSRSEHKYKTIHKETNIETNIRIVVQEIHFYCHCHQTFGLSYLFDDEPLSCLSRCGAVMLRSQLVSIPRSWKYDKLTKFRTLSIEHSVPRVFWAQIPSSASRWRPESWYRVSLTVPAGSRCTACGTRALPQQTASAERSAQCRPPVCWTCLKKNSM